MGLGFVLVAFTDGRQYWISIMVDDHSREYLAPVFHRCHLPLRQNRFTLNAKKKGSPKGSLSSNGPAGAGLVSCIRDCGLERQRG